MTEAALFKRCHKALGLSLNEMAAALLIAGDRNLRRWEDGHHPVSGPTWMNWARPDLRGGCAVMCIPTAILGHEGPFRPSAIAPTFAQLAMGRAGIRVDRVL